MKNSAIRFFIHFIGTSMTMYHILYFKRERGAQN